MLTLLTILFLALLILSHEFGHFLAAKILKIRVNEFGVGFPPKLFSKKMGGTEYSLNALPFGGFVRIYGEDTIDLSAIEDPEQSFHFQGFLKKILVVSAGVLTNILIGWVAFSIVLGFGISGGIIVGSVADGSPAFLAGIEAGETIEGFGSADDFLAYVDANRGQPILINDKTIVPRTEVPEGEGPLGISILPTGIEPQSFPQNIWSGLKMTFETLGLIFTALGSFLFNILTGNFGAVDQISGPIGVFNIVRDASQMGSVYFIQLLGLISLNLAALNTIPFPALDGGRFMFLALQKLFGDKMLNRRLEVVVNVVGFLFLMALMIAVTIRDIMNLQ
ncbi:MAG: site-2 protease family protein [Candidatus Colwellbacteria bacterium]|nr:site-2 protease family protein [Candidatus Colwellbacteria bacterium]